MLQLIRAACRRTTDDTPTMPPSETPQEGRLDAVQDWATFWLQLGIGLLISVAGGYCLTAIYLMAGGHLGPLSSRALLAASLIAAGAAIHLYDARDARFAILSAFAIYLASIFVSGALYETTIDGQHYHFQAIYALAKGWNPYHDAYAIPVDLAPLPAHAWVIHFPKGAWALPAIQYASGLALEYTKNQTLLLMLASCVCLLGVLLKFGYSPIVSTLIATCASANPVVANQVFTRMADGLLAASLLLFITFAMLWIAKAEKRALIAIAAAAVFSINLKFSALPMLAVLCAFTCLAWYKKSGTPAALSAATILGAIGIVSVVAFGYAPYVRNFIDHGHPFHPLMGAEAVDIMRRETLRSMAPLQRFFFSLFSETHSGFETQFHLKLPFTFALEEFRFAGGADTRIAAFGPLFSGALVIAVAAAIALLFRKWRDERVRYASLLTAGILVSVAILPENWWARYVPQLWLVPVVIAAAAIGSGERKLAMAGWLIVATLVVNTGAGFAASVWLSAKRHQALVAQVDQMRKENADYCVYFSAAQSRLVLLRQAHVKVRPIAQRDVCSNPEVLAAYGPDLTGGAVCRCSDVR